MQGWNSILLRLVLLALAGLLVGWLYDQPLIGLLLAVIAALGWHLMWLYRLDKWLKGEYIDFLPEGEGVWPRVFAKVDFLRRRGRRRGMRFKALLKQLRQATRTFPDAGIILNANNEIVIFNRAARDMLGLKKKDRGLRIENLIRAPAFVNYMRDKEEVGTVEIPSPLQNDRWLSCNAVPYGFDQQMLLVRDVTERRKLEEMRRDFVANASHELRTPLTVIAGYLEALAEDPGLSTDFAGPVREMQSQADRMRQLVDELLSLSELESDSVSRERPLDIGAMLHTARQAALVMEGCPAQVSVLIESDLGLCGNAKNIHSVISNLVSNAVRYTPQDGAIVLGWRVTDEGGFLWVRDTGIGIPREHLPRLCERFYRVEDGRERIGDDVGGTGLGLAIVKHALARHDAELSIESTPGQGSTFTCRFPPERIVPVAVTGG